MSEEWRDIPGMEGFYQASSEGRIRSVERVHMQRMRDGSVQGVKYGGKVRSLHWNKSNGYLMVALSKPGEKKKTYCAHYLVCAAFHGPRPEGLDAAHGDGVRANLAASNLSWKTRGANLADKVEHGTASIGERHGNCRLSDNDVREIRRLRSTGQRFKQIAARFGVSWETCRKINSGQKRRHVPMEALCG